MNATRLVLAVVWIGIGIYLIWIQPPQDPPRTWVGFLAFAFAAYNVLRWWLNRDRGLPLPSPALRRRPHDAPPELNEYNEAFHFENKSYGDRKDDNEQRT